MSPQSISSFWSGPACQIAWFNKVASYLGEFDQALAARFLTEFERDLTRSAKIDLEQWRSRPLHIRGREKLWSYFGEVF